MDFCKTAAVPVLLCVSEAWTAKEENTTSTQAAAMKFLRLIKGCTIMGYIRYEERRKDLEIF
jgi:hypothetical protein